MEQLVKQFDGSYSTESGHCAVVPKRASILLPDGSAVFEFKSAWNSKIISVKWDPSGPIALLDRDTAMLMIGLRYGAHPSEEQVVEYNKLVDAVNAATPPKDVDPPANIDPPKDDAKDGVVFPPEGWLPHPTSPGYFYKDQEVLTEEQLRAAINGTTE
jgi:hypothetical protein